MDQHQEENMNKSEYRALVQEGKGLVLQGAQGRLRLGEIAQEIAPKGENWGDFSRINSNTGDAPSAASAALGDYAAEIDVEPTTLREYRDVTLLWGGPAKAPKASWSVLRELAREDDPMAAYKAVRAEHGKVTIITVRTWRGRKTAGVRSTSPVADKAAQVASLLAEPEVVAAVVEDDKVRTSFYQADTKRTGRVTRERNEEVKRDFPFLVHATNVWGGHAKLGTALEALQSTYRLYSDSPELTEADRATALSKLAQIRQWVDTITTLMEKGDPFDAALEEILRDA